MNDEDNTTKESGETGGRSTNDTDRFLEWLNDEIDRRSEEIEELQPRNSAGEMHKRRSDRKVGINRGLRMARDEYASYLSDSEDTETDHTGGAI